MTPKKTIREHLDYKFIMALEGNDVASNLKWVMSSNSIAVMTRPTCAALLRAAGLRHGRTDRAGSYAGGIHFAADSGIP